MIRTPELVYVRRTTSTLAVTDVLPSITDSLCVKSVSVPTPVPTVKCAARTVSVPVVPTSQDTNVLAVQLASTVTQTVIPVNVTFTEL